MGNKTQTIQEWWSNVERHIICLTGIPEGKERQQEAEEIFEVLMAENFPTLMANIKPQTQEAQRTASRINSKHTHTHYIQTAKSQKQKEKILRKPENKNTLDKQEKGQEFHGSFHQKLCEKKENRN